MNLEKYKIKLQKERELLKEELAGIGKVDSKGEWQATSPGELSSQEVQDSGDLAEKYADYEERSSKLFLLESRLSDIENALEKIDNNKYGDCENCSKGIEEDRLEVNPAAPTCKNCMGKII